MEGWISLHRQIMEHPDYFSEKFTRTGAWIDLLLLASHRESVMRVRGIRVTIRRGEVAMSQEKLARRWKWSTDKTKRFLGELETDGQISRQKSNVIATISICNYDHYQNNQPTKPNTEPMPEQPAENLQNSRQNGVFNNVNKGNNTHTSSYSEVHTDAWARAGQLAAWIEAQRPEVLAMPEPLTPEQAFDLCLRYGDGDIRRIFGAMHNKGATGNGSAYETFLTFAGLDIELKARTVAAGKRYTHHEMADELTSGRCRQEDFEMRGEPGARYWVKRTNNT